MAKTFKAGRGHKPADSASAGGVRSSRTRSRRKPYERTWPGLIDKYIQCLLLSGQTSCTKASLVICTFLLLDTARDRAEDWDDLARSATKCLFVAILLYAFPAWRFLSRRYRRRSRPEREGRIAPWRRG